MADRSDQVDRRSFIRTSAATSAALSFSAASYSRTIGSNERIGIALLGCGARAQAHLDIIKRLGQGGANARIVAVCDVWDGLEDEYLQEFGGKKNRRKYCQGLYPSARKAGLNPSDPTQVNKNFHAILELKHVDAVCVATPDHWHARMAIASIEAGKDAYIEKPLCRTYADAIRISELAQKRNVVVSVGIQSLCDPSWAICRERIRAGQLGHLVLAQTSLYRNDIRGHARFIRLCSEMTPKTIDWPMFLGMDSPHATRADAVAAPVFDRALYGHWRCYGRFCDGLLSDLLLPRATCLLYAMDLQIPTRVSASAGLYVERDGRDLPDLVSVIADFREGCQLLLTGSTLSNYPGEESIRGRLGAIRFTQAGIDFFADNPSNGSVYPKRLGDKAFTSSESIRVGKPSNETETLWLDFLDCIRHRTRQTISPPELSAPGIALTQMSKHSYQTGQAVGPECLLPRDSDSSSSVDPHLAGRDHHWQTTAGELQPPSWIKLAGPWNQGIDPARL